MVGIKSLGAYVPLHRLSYEEIGKAWGISLGKGERTVSSFDEDSLTMAVEAAVDCLNKSDRSVVDGVFFQHVRRRVAGRAGSAAARHHEIGREQPRAAIRCLGRGVFAWVPCSK